MWSHLWSEEEACPRPHNMHSSLLQETSSTTLSNAAVHAWSPSSSSHLKRTLIIEFIVDSLAELCRHFAVLLWFTRIFLKKKKLLSSLVAYTTFIKLFFLKASFFGWIRRLFFFFTKLFFFGRCCLCCVRDFLISSSNTHSFSADLLLTGISVCLPQALLHVSLVLIHSKSFSLLLLSRSLRLVGSCSSFLLLAKYI